MLESKTIAMLTQTVTAVMLARKGEMNSSATFFRMGCFVSWMLCFFYLSNIRMCKYTVPSIWGQNLIIFFSLKQKETYLCVVHGNEMPGHDLQCLKTVRCFVKSTDCGCMPWHRALSGAFSCMFCLVNASAMSRFGRMVLRCLQCTPLQVVSLCL